MNSSTKETLAITGGIIGCVGLAFLDAYVNADSYSEASRLESEARELERQAARKRAEAQRASYGTLAGALTRAASPVNDIKFYSRSGAIRYCESRGYLKISYDRYSTPSGLAVITYKDGYDGYGYYVTLI